MDGRGRVFDNIFIERLWRSVKYEEVYVKNYESVRDAVEGLTRYFELYNRERLHESPGYRTPHEVYFSGNSHSHNHDDGDACRLIHQIQPIFLS
jgi:putative transposase